MTNRQFKEMVNNFNKAYNEELANNGFIDEFGLYGEAGKWVTLTTEWREIKINACIINKSNLLYGLKGE